MPRGPRSGARGVYACRVDVKREAYPFAGALCVAAGNLLTSLHQIAGSPPTTGAQDLPGEARRLWTAVGVTFGAAASCAALSARLLLMERESLREQLTEIDAPLRFEFGVTTLEGTESRAWRGTVRAAAAARTELARCAGLWPSQEFGDAVPAAIQHLAAYVDELVAVLERTEPAEPSAESVV